MLRPQCGLGRLRGFVKTTPRGPLFYDAGGIGLPDVKFDQPLVADDPLLVDEEAVGDGFEAIESSEKVLLVHHGSELSASPLDIRPGPLRALSVHCHSQDLDVLVAVFLEELLPYRQLLAAASP